MSQSDLDTLINSELDNNDLKELTDIKLVVWNLWKNDKDKLPNIDTWKVIHEDNLKNEQFILGNPIPNNIDENITDKNSQRNMYSPEKNDTNNIKDNKINLEDINISIKNDKENEDNKEDINEENKEKNNEVELVKTTEVKKDNNINLININDETSSSYFSLQSKFQPLKNWNLNHINSVSLNDELNKTNVSQGKKESELITEMLSMPDLQLIVTGNQIGIIKFWNYDEFTLEHLIDEPICFGKVKTLCYMFDKKNLFAGGGDSTLILINLVDGESKWKVEKFASYSITPAISLEGKNLKESNESNDQLKGSISKICSALDYQHIFYNIGPKIACFDNYNKKLTNIFEYQKQDINSMVYIEKLHLLVYSTNKTINYIDPYNNNIKYSLNINNSLFNLTACSGKQFSNMICGTRDNEIIFYSLSIPSSMSFNQNNLSINSIPSNNCFEIVKYKIYKYKSNIVKVSYCYDDKTILIALQEGIFFLQNIDVEENKKKGSAFKNPFSNGCYFGDGHTLAMSSEDGNVDVFSC